MQFQILRFINLSNAHAEKNISLFSVTIMLIIYERSNVSSKFIHKN